MAIAQIPERIPTVIVDRFLLLAEESGAAKLVLQVELHFDQTLDEDRLAKALDLLLDAEPVLGCRMVPDPDLPFWQRLGREERKNFCFTLSEPEYLNFRNSSQDPCRGPQVQACLFRKSRSDQLLIKICHQAADAGGAKEIAGILSSIYQRLEKEPGFKPEPNLSGCRDWSQITSQIPLWAYPIILLNHLRESWSNLVPHRTNSLKLQAGPAEPLTYVLRHIPPERTEKIARFGKERNATINDVIVAAYHRALVKAVPWDGKSALRMKTTLDLRRWYLPGRKAEGICNLSSFESPNLGFKLGKDLAETTALISAYSRKRKKSWIGFTEGWMYHSILRINPFSYQRLRDWGIKTLPKILEILEQSFPNTLTNMGEIKPETVEFGAKPKSAWLLSPFLLPPIFISGLSGHQNTLTLCAGVPVYAGKTIESFYDLILAELPS